ncbi:guanine-N(7)-methyltransferase domain-containing protein [Pavlovales sp. CCMP2436]|nr:guanine-N(7)-methyltransferase domain-containing protein [Pavlovales sp. CCMP2436]
MPPPAPQTGGGGSRWKSFKRARSPERGPQAVAASTAAASLVAQHYNKRANTMRTTTSGATMLGLRNLNNWIKSVLLGQHLSSGCSVLDFACGKGGDMLKYNKAGIGHYVGIDIAKGSVADAVGRYNAAERDSRFPPMPFTARFLAGDCFAVDLASHLPPALRFDVVSCQFALHYAFESEARARQAIRNAAARIQPGGHFVGTIPDASVLCTKLKGAPSGEFSNVHYRVVFDASLVGEGRLQGAMKKSPFGVRYRFTLEDAVEDVPEYLIFKPVIERIAAEEGLKLVCWANFHDYFAEQWSPQLELLKRMKVLPPPDHRMTEAEWEVAYLYTVFVFEKQAPPDSGPRMKAPHPGRRAHTRVDPANIVECASLPGIE